MRLKTIEPLIKIEQRLLQRQSELLELADVSESAAETVDLDQSKVGRLSRMDAMQAQAMSVETNRRRVLELAKIKAALSRIANDEYGFCIHCDESIAFKRLEIDPAATMCIKCAEQLEE